MAEEVKLFGVWASPVSRRVEVALKLKGIPYEYIEEDLTNKSPLLLKYNQVYKKLPVLVYNGKLIAESLVILEYIDETWKGNPILPEDPHERAAARLWAKFMDEKQKSLPAARKALRAKEKEREKAMEEVWECLKALEGALKNKKFFGGETIGEKEVVGIKLLTAEKFPILFKWSEEYVGCPIIKENPPPRVKIMAFFKSRFEKVK